MSDNIDYQLVNAINTSYGIKISNGAPSIIGANIPKIRAVDTRTNDIWVNGVVKTILRLTNQITTVSGNLVLSSATGIIDLTGMTIINFTTDARQQLDLVFQANTPVNPPTNTLRVFANSTGQIAWKTSAGNITAFSSDNLTANRVFTLPDVSDTLVSMAAPQTLTNKTSDSAANTITITSAPLSAANVNTVLNQDVRTTANPTFASMTLTSGLTEFSNTVIEVSGTNTTVDATPLTVYTLPTSSDQSYLILFYATGFVTAGTDAGTGIFFRTLNGVTNNSGVLSINGAFSNTFARNGISTSNVTITASGTNANHNVVGTAARTIRWKYYIRVIIN